VAGRGGPMLMHSTYFKLENNSASKRNRFVRACKRYLSGHSGQAKGGFFIGPRDTRIKRNVSDLGFDIAMSILFKNVAAYHAYLKDPRHNEFIKETANISNTRRVFDCFVL